MEIKNVSRRDGKETFKAANPNLIKKIHNLRNTVSSLETNFQAANHWDKLQLSRFKNIELSKERLEEDLKESEKRNSNMLNLFRYNADLPQGLKTQVEKKWNQKYDALLKLNDHLKRQIREKDSLLQNKDDQIAVLQQKLLDIGEKLSEREELIKTISNKYIKLKKRKTVQETLFKESIETLLRDALLEENHNNTPTTSRMSLKPTKEALLAYETKRSNRLSRENYLLRTILQKIKVNCHCHENSDSSASDSLGANN
ncbi:uncharacterized protein LOC123265752 [Cotesia glomerata]|uniref:uncharacterized protein LOC123265752 n=1 Tax=Cotesia glomerata TaxID=32391 RepID=UPI001D0307B5|nr:uncharacterized protein LOC123265752 [Cotesia glomerata]